MAGILLNANGVLLKLTHMSFLSVLGRGEWRCYFFNGRLSFEAFEELLLQRQNPGFSKQPQTAPCKEC